MLLTSWNKYFSSNHSGIGRIHKIVCSIAGCLQTVVMINKSCCVDTKSKGFAMVELLIIFVVVVLLAVMTVPIFKKMNEATNKEKSAPDPALIEEVGLPKPE
jgi:hypothetical protein